jgi:hypothetical protein
VDRTFNIYDRIKAEIRRRAAAIVTEFGTVPQADDSGIVEAERRLHGLREARRKLHEEFPWNIAIEEEIIEPTLTATENALVEFIEDTPAESLHAAAVKLRETIVGTALNETATLRQVLATIEREIAPVA